MITSAIPRVPSLVFAGLVSTLVLACGSPNLAGTNTQTPFIAPNEGILIENSFGTTDVTGGLTLADVLSAMRSGNAYCNVHTVNFPGGEIRGQIRSISVD